MVETVNFAQFGMDSSESPLVSQDGVFGYSWSENEADSLGVFCVREGMPTRHRHECGTLLKKWR